MTPTAIVLASVALGLAAGSGLTIAIVAAKRASRRRSLALRPELPEVAVEVLEALDLFAVVLDASLTPVFANRAARSDASVSGDELRSPEFLRRARRVMSTGVTDIREPDPSAPGDTVRLHTVRVQRRFLVVLAQDMGEEQRLNAMRRDFIANVSHELKTPIAAIGLLSEAVLEGADEPEVVRTFAKKLRRESARLGNLSRDIIQLSEAQSAFGAAEREPVVLRDVVLAEVDAHQAFAAEHGVELGAPQADSAEEDAVTLGHPPSIAIAVANLLSNAIRHSPRGGRVGIGIDTDGASCTVTVTDQGEGIAEEQLPRIFERFYRIDTARSREQGGTGLGLSIARHTMRAHGGDITVWSQPGVGSSFSLVFPILDGADGDRQTKKKKKKKKKKKAKNSKTRDALREPSMEGSPE